MIIECKNCLKKFTVRDSDIPINGRTVQCSNCSTQWLQMPITHSTATDDFDVEDVERESSSDEFKASDGKKYKFLGSQWAQVLPTGKTGRLAKKKISNELNILTGKKKKSKGKIIIKSDQSTNQYQETEGGMGIFSFLIVLIFLATAIILFLDTFKNQLTPFFPDLENYLVYIFESINNIYVIIKDFFNNYK